MRLFRWGFSGCVLLLAACGTDGGGTSGARDGGSGGAPSSGGASGSAGTSSSGGMGTECKTTGDCPQTDCFGCPPNVCVNGRCTSMTTGNGGAIGSGGVAGDGGSAGAGGTASGCAGAVLVYAGDARCQAWLESYCCVEAQSCESDSTCRAAVECINRCPSPKGGACVANCAPGAIPPLDDIATCSKAAPSPTGSQCAWPQ